MLKISLWIAFILCAIAALLLASRLLSHKTAATDKLLALDTLYLLAVVWILLAGVYWQHTYYWAIALVVGLLGFASTVAVAKHLSKNKVISNE